MAILISMVHTLYHDLKINIYVKILQFLELNLRTIQFYPILVTTKTLI